ncbi:Ubiquitin fusion degradation protein 4 [Mortierella sp. AD094]|nr:Ubiquitin fusion degradation protein 4 [Mortierella sp. AD094]
MTGLSSTTGSSQPSKRLTSKTRQHSSPRSRLASPPITSLHDKILDDGNIPSKEDHVNTVTSGSRTSQTMPLLHEPSKEVKASMTPKNQNILHQSNQQRVVAQDQKPKVTALSTIPPTRSLPKRRSTLTTSTNTTHEQGCFVQTLLTLPLSSQVSHRKSGGNGRKKVDDSTTAYRSATVQGVDRSTESEEPTKDAFTRRTTDLVGDSQDDFKITEDRTTTSTTHTTLSIAPSNSSSVPSLLPPTPTILTSYAITRHQAQVSEKARLDYLTFSTGIDGTLPIPNIAFSSSTRASSSNIPSPNPRKRTFPEASQTSQCRSDSQSQIQINHKRSKQPRLTTTSTSTPSSSTAPSSPVVTRARAKAAESQKKHHGIASFMRQSKTSTSQKRSNPSIKSAAKHPQDMSSSSSLELSSNSQPKENDDQDKENSGTSDNCTGDQAVTLESQVKNPSVLPEEREGDPLDNQNSKGQGENGDNQANNGGGEIDEEGEDEDGENEDEDEDEDDGDEDEDEDEDEDDYDHSRQADQDGLFSSGGSMGGMVSGMSSRLKAILTNLRAYQDPSLQLIALQDLAVLLSVSTEETLQGYFSNDAFVKELVLLMRGTGDGDDNPEIMLLACRCLSNLMEAIPSSLGSVVHGGAVPVLCSKLIEIQYIDLAEQSLTTLEKISSEYPHAVVKEGGLAAVLMFLDFFSTNVQRTAVKTAANCCRGIQHDSITMVQDILPNLENIIQYSDQKIVEQTCLCFVRLADSYKSNVGHLQTIITETILRSILSLLSPNANVVVGTIAEYSPTLGFALLEMDIVDTLFLVLTGVHAPDTNGENDGPLTVSNIGSRPKEQVSDIIGIITELLPPLPKDDPLFDTEYKYVALKNKEKEQDEVESQSEDVEMAASAENHTDKREELLKSHPDRVRRIGRILIPTLIEVYSSTVHLRVRQRAIHALVKLIYFTNDSVLNAVLKTVELASFLAIILSQQEHQSLVVAALQIADILMAKMPSVYSFYFEREGVTFEISKLACLGAEVSLSKEIKIMETAAQEAMKSTKDQDCGGSETETATEVAQKAPELEKSIPVIDKEPASEPISDTASKTIVVGQRLVDLMSELRSMRNLPDQERTVDQQLEAIEKELEVARSRYQSPSQSDETTIPADTRTSTLDHLRTLRHFITGGSRSVIISQKEEKGLGSGKTKDWIFERSRIIVDTLQTAAAVGEAGLHKGTSVLADLKRMAGELAEPVDVASRAVKELADYFTRLGATGISSFEFLNSGLPLALLNYLVDAKDSKSSHQGRRVREFIQEFMTIPQGNSDKSTATVPLSVLVKKMQEALTRMEMFEVESAQTSLVEARNNSSSSLATQVRLKLTPDEGTEVPPGYQNLVVSIHAIATFRTLDEYLRPRLKPKLSVPETKPTLNNEKNGSMQGRSDSGDVKLAPEPTGNDERPHSPVKLESDENPTNNLRTESLQAGDAKDVKINNSSDDSLEDSDGDIEMDYDMESAASVQNTKASDTSAVDMDSDVKMTEVTQANSETPSADSVKNGESLPLKSRSSALPKKDRSAAGQQLESLSSSWHIQFSLHGSPISTDRTVYGAIHDYERKNGKSASQRNLWSFMYPIKYKRVESPPPEQSALAASSQCHGDLDLTFTSQMPKELPQHADYAPILGLLRVLHGLNDDWRRFLGAEDQPLKGTVQHLPSNEFINSKISAKVNRQLEEPLIVASSCLPDWIVGLVTGFPFLFPFETRYTYLQSTAFGFSRSIMRWQNQQQRGGHTDQRDESQTFLGRIQRQKVRISRQKALESAVRVMDLYGANQAMLEVEYFDEVGTGLGPTLEFYSLVSKEFCKKPLKLWRDGDSESSSEYVTAPQGLFPRPMVHLKDHSDNEKKILKLFRSLGQFIAKAMLDSRIIDVPLSTLFVSQLLGRNREPHLQLVSTIDPVLARSLQSLQAFVTEKKRIYGLKLPSKERESALKNIELHGSKLDDLSLDFTLAGYPEIELKGGGANIPVTIYNVEEYINLTLDFTVGRGIQAQVSSFREGFNNVFSIQNLAGFRSGELVGLFGSGEEDWSYETLVDSVKADHGFRSESRAFKNLLRVMSELNKEERRQFLQFITGSPKLPIGGFKNLHPPFTVVCKPFEAPLKADDYLPSVMTCANYLKMPDYSCKEVTLSKFKMAYEEGQGSFHLS